VDGFNYIVYGEIVFVWWQSVADGTRTVSHLYMSDGVRLTGSLSYTGTGPRWYSLEARCDESQDKQDMWTCRQEP